MKRIILFLMAATLLLAACNNNKPKEKVTIDPTQMQNAAAEMQKKTEYLQKLTPVTLDQLKAFLPETLMEAKRSNFNVANTMGAGLATAEYEMNDSTNIKLSVYDCAGSAGAGIYSLQYLGMYNLQQESDEEYTKTIELNGGKAFEHCQKQSNECTLTYFSGDRFLISLEGNNVGADALKQAAGSLNIK